MKNKTHKHKPDLEENLLPGNELDRIDRKILNVLQNDNQITNLALAEEVGISPPPCFRRVKRLRDAGIIAKDVSIIDPFKAGGKIMVLVSVSLEKQREDLLAHFERKMMEQTEVMQCYFVSGDVDYILLLHVNDVNHYNEFSRRVFTSEANIRMYRSYFCLSRVKYNTKVELPED